MSAQQPKIVRKGEGLSWRVMGDQQVIKLSGDHTNGQFTLIEQTNEPGAGIPPHVHEREDEVFHLLTGQVEMTLGGATQTLKAGDLIFCPRGVPHSWKVTGQGHAKVMMSVFPAGIELMFEELAKLPEGPPDLDRVAEICGRYGLRFL
ncbi:cupin domain-containing protein [Persicobacter psychrovividus]|uniref:Cupin type-2 domain-containing protein n=1 Tax=Persicobacter psychrovividus TaxID=387638 RepID=A0ABM7VG04_9BACT|nr:hypothetical protein PEPS_21170 [Persicobacter psychrovividus]